MFTRLLYYSKVAQNLAATEVARIFVAATNNNSRSGITGVLFSDGTQFVQILEGSRHEVSEIFNKILQDKRHRKIVLASVSDIPEITFESWGMGLLKNEPFVEEILERETGSRRLVPEEMSADDLFRLLVVLTDERLRNRIPIITKSACNAS